jgi:phosphatidate cytidylyltransferase
LAALTTEGKVLSFSSELILMLQTRLWVGTILVLLTIGMLAVDRSLAPWFPFLFVFVVGLTLAAARELVDLLGPAARPQVPVLYAGVGLLATSNWWAHAPRQAGWSIDPWQVILLVFTGLTMAVFLWEIACFQQPDAATASGSGPIERMAITLWALAYLGFLPCFLAQARWLYPANQLDQGSVALALLIFVPKCCDIGAYTAGRLFGRHPMAPVLSPKKTWEGAIGGVALGVLAAVGVDRLGPAPLLGKSPGQEIGFGIALSFVGTLGDLAESLIKRACRRKDASAAVPGFGGVLDIVDSVIFAAPVGYLWLRGVRETAIAL